MLPTLKRFKKAGKPPVFAVVRFALALALAPVLFLSSPGYAQQSERGATRDYDIPAGPLDEALLRFIDSSGLFLAGNAELAAGLRTAGVKGTYSAGEALRRLLAGTGLQYRFTAANTVTLQQTTADRGSGATALDPITVEGETESAYGPVEGYRAERSATATKTDTPIRDIPNSIQVVPRQIIEDQQAIGLEEVLSNAAGVSFLGNDFGRNLEFAIRGFDNAPILRNGSNLFAFGATPAEVEVANLERVEVIRGPSVLYGLVEPGGAVNLVTKKPLDEPYYNFEFQAGNRGLVSPMADISGRITEDGSLLYRMVALYRREDSFQDYDESFKRVFVAPSATWRPTDKTDLTVRLEYTKDKDPAGEGLPALGDKIADIPFDRVMNNPDETIDQETLIAGYEFEHRFNDAWKLRNQFSYIYGYYEFSVLALTGTLNEATGVLSRDFGSQFNRSQTFTTDTNLQGKFSTGPFDHTGLVGVDFTRATERSDTRFGFGPGFFTPIDIFDPDYFAVPTPKKSDIPVFFGNDTERRQVGAYAQDQVDLLDNLILVGGLRFDSFTRKDEDTVSGGTTRNDETALTPRIGGVFRPIEPVSLYANYAESFLPNTATDSSGSALPPEEGVGFEVGVKIDFIPDRLSSTLAFFNIRKKNVETADPVVPFASVATGEVRSRGFDADLTGEILPGWNVVVSYAFIDAEVTEDNNPDIVGNELTGIPRHSAGAWTTYEIQGGRFKGLGGGVGFNYVGERQGDLDNSFKVDDYVVANAGLFYRWRNWQARLNVDNIFDVDYIESVSGNRTNGSVPGAPLTIRGSISATF